MAVHRETPKCLVCGKVIAKAIMGGKTVGDNFIGWKFIKHKCKKKSYTKEEFLKAAELGEVSMIDAKHVVSLLDEAKNYFEQNPA
jgi:hypothetical protein